MNEKAKLPNTLLRGERVAIAFKPQESARPDHLIELPGEQWSLWRCVGLRGAGFPVEGVLKLSAPDCAAAADQVLAAEQEAQSARKEAIDVVNNMLDDLRSNSGWGDKERREPLVKAIRLLKMSKLPEPLKQKSPAQAAIESLRAASDRCDSLLPLYQQSYKKSLSQTSQAIRELLASNRFREAIIWQNRRAFHTGVEMLLRKPPADASRGSKQRQHEELIASYWQRYCVKNDTIGFFGPVGWAKLISQGPPIVLKPGKNLLAARNVYFEWWCIDALAKKIASDESFKPWLVPTRTAYIYLESTNVYLGSSYPLKVSSRHAAVLQACDGKRMAKEIALDLIGQPSADVVSEQALYYTLDELCDKGLITWSLEVPNGFHPERELQQMLERVGDGNLREPALAALQTLISARDAIKQSAGDAEQLDAAIREMEATFTGLTGLAATRGAGKTYAARTLVYEDCRREMEMELGPQFIESFGAALSLMLTSARWFTYQVAQAYRVAFKKLYEELSRSAGSPVIAAVDFWVKAHHLLYSNSARPIDDVVPEFQRRWAEVLSIPPGAHRVNYDSEDLSARILAAFYAPHPGWKYARYHSPDLMIAARSAEALRLGDYELILGELHIAVNTLMGALFVAQHPSKEELFRAIELDIPEPMIVPTISNSADGANMRTRQLFESPKDFQLALTHDSFAPRIQ